MDIDICILEKTNVNIPKLLTSIDSILVFL